MGVRAGGLSWVRLTRHRTAHLVYSEELVDRSVLATERRVRALAAGEVIEYVQRGSERVVFATTAAQRSSCIFQLGTASAALALQAAQHIAADCAGVDVNMGCPKPFSIKGGMGAALLKQPDTVADILKVLVAHAGGGPLLSHPAPQTLRSNLPAHMSVTCKIRLLSSEHDTLQFVRMVEGCGVSAVAVHGRLPEQRDDVPADWDAVKRIAEAVRIPVILNGDVFAFGDFERARAATGAAGVMCARAALANPSVFRATGPLPLFDVARDYLAKAKAVSNHIINSKWVLQVSGNCVPEGPRLKMGCQSAHGERGVSQEDPAPIAGRHRRADCRQKLRCT